MGDSKSSHLALPTPLVSAAWLKENLHHPKLVVVDASWHMPAASRDAKAEFLAAHITGARFFDIDTHSDHTTDLPHMLPTAEAFESAMNALGISNQSTVVVYDTAGLFSAARLWWSLRVFGHANVAVLDGGLPAWREAGYATESGEPAAPSTTHFTAHFNAALLRHKADMLNNLATPTAHVVDARGAERFAGSAPEPRAGVRSGHIPNSRNLHYASLLTGTGKMKSKTELLALMQQAGITPEQPVIASCGSGVTACIIDLALESVGHTQHAVYDGSWAEWGGAADTPVAKN